MKAAIFDIQRGSTVDGPGIRTTVFFKGCNLKCKWCHNPESQKAEIQMMFYKDKCGGCGTCKRVCPNGLSKCTLCGKCSFYCPSNARRVCGKEYTADEIFFELIKDKAFYDNSGGGVTFSGGECMLQIDFLEELLKKCRDAGIHTAVDTAGNVPFEYFRRIIPYTNLFLYDIKCISKDKHNSFTGVSNERILENFGILTKQSDVIVRIPVVPSFNDGEEEFEKIGNLLKGKSLLSAELLPYHRMGENKFNAIGEDVTIFNIPPKEKMESLKAVIRKYTENVT